MNDVKAKLNQLVSAYRKRLPEIESDLDDTWNSLTNENQKEALTRLVEQLHALKGSSGTFGYPKVSWIAGQYEDTARDCQAGLNAGTLSFHDVQARLGSHQLELKSVLAGSTVTEPDSADEREASRRELRREAVPQGVLYLYDDQAEPGQHLREAIETEGLSVITLPLSQLNRRDDLGNLARIAVVEAAESEDQILPLMSPLQYLKEAGIKTVVITDGCDFEGQLALVRAGVMGCVVRPVSVDEVIRHLLKVVSDDEQALVRVMIVDDQTDVAEYYETLLNEEGMAVRVESDLSTLFFKIDQFEPDIVLLDINMPVAHGSEIARMLRMHECYATLPILFLTGNQYPSQERSGLIGIGTDDLLEKGMDPSALVRQVRNRAQRARLLKSQVTTDGLSGLFNHRHIMMQARRYCELAKRTGIPTSLVLVDLDHFKSVNDTYGHDVGDVVIRALSKLLRSRVRSTDLVGRYGGEEFILVLPSTTQEEAAKLANNLLEVFREQQFSAEQGTFTVTFSAGASDSSNNAELDGMFNSVDKALYKAKQKGRNQVQLL